MSDIRRVHKIRRNFGRKQDTAKRIFSKVVTVIITGTDVDAIKKTTQEIYSYQNEFTSGGRNRRTVQITKVESTDVETVFFGRT
jgi:hypothetical protein